MSKKRRKSKSVQIRGDVVREAAVADNLRPVVAFLASAETPKRSEAPKLPLYDESTARGNVSTGRDSGYPDQLTPQGSTSHVIKRTMEPLPKFIVTQITSREAAIKSLRQTLMRHSFEVLRSFKKIQGSTSQEDINRLLAEATQSLRQTLKRHSFEVLRSSKKIQASTSQEDINRTLRETAWTLEALKQQHLDVLWSFKTTEGSTSQQEDINRPLRDTADTLEALKQQSLEMLRLEELKQHYWDGPSFLPRAAVEGVSNQETIVAPPVARLKDLSILLDTNNPADKAVQFIAMLGERIQRAGGRVYISGGSTSPPLPHGATLLNNHRSDEAE